MRVRMKRVSQNALVTGDNATIRVCAAPSRDIARMARSCNVPIRVAQPFAAPFEAGLRLGWS